jgi:hypothetical protein
MKFPLFFLLVFLGALLPPANAAESEWPRELTMSNVTVVMYQPQSDSLVGDHLFSRTAISIMKKGSSNPIFGALWTEARFSTDRSTGTCTIFDVKMLNVRFPGIDTIDKGKVAEFKSLIEKEIISWNITFSLEELKSTLETVKASNTAGAKYKNDPPEIIYQKQKSFLVLFDGNPVYKETGKDGPNRVINTPFLVLQDTREKQVYLYGGQYWYKSGDAVKEPFKMVSKPSPQVAQYVEALKKEMSKQAQQQPEAKKEPVPPMVVVRTTPAELIQSDGEPKYAPIQGTQLLYVTNTEDNIFMTVDKNTLYVLLSGRWYSAAALTGPWKYIESEKLPSDFAKIPEGSPKDIVLASVAGTDAAREAVMDAQIPQTAAVDRKTAKCEVKWDGDPKFEKISGTELARGMNTSSVVLMYKNTYYVCDNAVWFTGKGPVGPWEVATSIPSEIQKIPPEDPTYNVKYVYIYDVQPEVVYIGYTPGYVGCYVYGPTVIYGTGYPYVPFYGPYYYPRPVTYGFSMHYNPWYGWSMGFSMSYGMFTFSVGGPVGHGGYWGPPRYYPPYHPPYSHYYGGRPPVYRGGGNTINIDNSVNIYGNRPDKSTRVAQQPVNRTKPVNDRMAPTTRQTGNAARTDGGSPSTRNNVFTDQKGDVYRNNNGNWEKNNGRDWESAKTGTREQAGQVQQRDRSNTANQDLNRQNQLRERGNQNSMNRNNATRSAGGRSGGGGARRGR